MLQILHYHATLKMSLQGFHTDISSVLTEPMAIITFIIVVLVQRRASQMSYPSSLIQSTTEHIDSQ